MQPESQSSELRQLIKDAQWAIWLFVIVNFFVLVFFLLDGIFNEFVFVLLFIQSALLIFWLLPVFCYQVFIKKLRVKLAMYKALASYKEAIGHVSW
jgi:fatty acid desaturase